MGSSGGGAFLPGDPPPSTGQVLNQPTGLFSVQNVTATGATGSTAAALTYPGVPVFVTATGASGAGVAFVTGAAVPGAAYVIKNNMTGALNLYAVGGTINGVTGTTAYAITATGNLTATAWCSAAGTWQVGGNT